MSSPMPSSNSSDTAALIEAAAKAQLSRDPGQYLGPFIIGFAVDLVLFGVMIHQFTLWQANYAQERWTIRIFVCISVSLGVATTAFEMWWSWTLFVAGFGQYTNFLEVDNVLVIVMLSAFTSLTVQIFYAERVYRLFHDRLWAPILVAPFILTAWIAAIIAKVKADQLESFFQAHLLEKHFYVWMGSTLATDLLLTSLILAALVRQRTGWSHTDKLINRLIKMSMESQLPATLCAIALMVTFGVKSTSTLVIMWELVHPKLYVVSLLAVLNYRFSLRKTMNSSQDAEFSQRRSNTFALSSRRQQQTQLDKIHVDTATYQESHEMQLPRVGLNRTAQLDEESGDYPEDRYSSQTQLTGNIAASQRPL